VFRWLNRACARTHDDGGFTLIEIMVALTLVLTSAAAAIPLLIVGMRAANVSKLNTQAKNLAQQRMESMRDLPFHVDQQNGPFIDLLDIYYTNVSTTSSTRNRANETEVTRWYASGAPAPAPSGPVFHMSVAALPGFSGFSQTIDTQFLGATGNVLPASGFTSYDSQTAGRDQPPAAMVGVTVTTTWSDHGSSKSYTSYTRIADSRGQTSALTTQGNGTFLRVTASGQAANALTVDVAGASAVGGQSTGSVAAAEMHALQAHDASGTDYTGASGVATSPDGTVSQSSPLSGFTSAGGSDCGWVGVGPTQVADVTASTDGGLPKVPSDVDSGIPPAHVSSAQLTSGSNGACGIFGFSNQSTSYDSKLMLDSDTPLVRIANDSGNGVVASGSAWVNATSLTAVHSVSAGASASSTKRVQLFPGASFVTDGAGVVDFRLTQSSIACTSVVTGGVAAQSATGLWTVTVDYWQATDILGHGIRVTLPAYVWNSATDAGSIDPLAALNLGNIVVYQMGTTTLHLSDYIQSWSTARSIVENPTSGVHQLDAVVSITTQPVRQDDLISALGVEIGRLSCVADDNR